MPKSTLTRPGRRKLSDVARHLIVPSGIVSTGWPAVEAQCDRMGVRHDDWQVALGRVILAKRESGLYAAGVGGVVMSLPRQVGKTFTIGSIVFALCVLVPRLTVLWTAHHSRTSNETFASLQGFANRQLVAPHVEHVRQANGQQEIAFKNGSRVLFGARESGFGRGFADVDVEVFDEAQILSQRALDDMVPATNTAANPLVFLIGTPPKPTDPSEVFTARRREALSGQSSDMLFVEMSADADADPDSRSQWRAGNPSFPARTPETAMLRMRHLLGEESFIREGLGVWSSDVVTQPLIADDLFLSRAVPAAPDGVVSYGVKFSPDGAHVGLGVAVRPDDGPVHVDVVAIESTSRGTTWLVDWLASRWRQAAQIVVDGRGSASALVNALVEAGVSERVLKVPTTQDVVAAHAMFLDSVRTGAMSWFEGQDALRFDVANATKRPIGTAGGWGWAPIGDGHVLGLEAVTLADYGARTTKRRPGRKARVLL